MKFSAWHSMIRRMNARPSRLFAPLTAILMAVAAQAGAAPLRDVAAVPHLDARGEQGYRQFLAAPLPRAFAIAPGGAWGMSEEASSGDLAEREALANCQANSAQHCRLYARDLDVVLDSADWVRAWGPYKSAAQARISQTGKALGSRFPDLAFADAQGKPVKLSDLRGKVVVLHFWGSWCPPCQREMPELARLASHLKKAKDIRFVLLQVREDFASARRWAGKFGDALPLYDSGMKHDNDHLLKLAGGNRLSDRDIAMAFPTTYVIDKHGIVVFAHVGPLAKWEQYLAFLRDVAAHSGK